MPWKRDKNPKPVVYPEISVSASWLADHLTNPQLVVVDVRPTTEFQTGHIPRAISLPESAFPDFVNPGPSFALRGLHPDLLIVCYGDTRTFPAVARLYWLLQLAGATEVRVLDGGIVAWQRQEQKLETDTTNLAPVAWPAKMDSELLATKKDVANAYGVGGYEIIDARASGFGDTQTAMNTPDSPWRTGHIPHALPVDFLALLAEAGELPPPEEARHRIAEVGPRPNTTVNMQAEFIIYDDGFNSAGLRGYLLLRLAGIEKVRYFPGGWAAWSADPDLPVVRIVEAADLQHRLEAERDSRQNDTPTRGFLLLDVRHSSSYDNGHIPGAVNIMPPQMEDSLETVVQRNWPDVNRKQTPCIVYCYGVYCIRSRFCAAILARHGFLQLEWFRGGLPEWKKEKGSLAGGESR